ncbi:MAG: DUF1190 domain-containing protein [Brevundimonas sp.]|nr:MAG: DUF1190 domain-containing protein [Brevundimonas sp.]
MSQTNPTSAQPTASPETTTMRRLKRSRTLHLTSLMATVGFSLSACGAPDVSAPPAEEPEAALAYTSLDDCRSADVIPDEECDTAYNAAQSEAAKSAPSYATRSECEGQWGPEQCRPLQSTNGASFFGPLATGFVIGQMLNGGRSGAPLYRDRDGEYSNGYGGGYLGRDYRTGRNITRANDHPTIARQAPTRVQSRTTVVSRGGFGGGGRGFGG